MSRHPDIAGLDQATIDALIGALVSRGPTKGMLRATAPSPFKQPQANAAWNAAMMSVNPYKVSIFSIMCLNRSPELKRIYEQVEALFDFHPELRSLDRDRAGLERLGVW